MKLLTYDTEVKPDTIVRFRLSEYLNRMSVIAETPVGCVTLAVFKVATRVDKVELQFLTIPYQFRQYINTNQFATIVSVGSEQ